MLRTAACSALLSLPPLCLSLGGCHDPASGAGARDQIKIVGSSTVYPFTTLVAEQFVTDTPGAKPPVVESTGTGGGIKLFCAGIGAGDPDIADASRRMKRGEYETCRRNGVREVMEVQVGIDGIAFAEARGGPGLSLTATDLYRALAATPGGRPNAARTWRDVNPALPAVPIQVYGPPATSGTRDALAELILSRGCEAAFPAVRTLKERNEAAYDKACHTVRSDGPYVDAGENDNLIVQKLESNPNAVGVFGYSYLEANAGQLRGIPVNGSDPTYPNIASGRYPGARPLFIYVKKARLNAVHGLRGFLQTYTTMWGANGPLVKHGLIAAPDPVLQDAAAVIATRRALDPRRLPG